MLFDLQATGRRRAVKIIYGFLAILIGGGLVLFGVGGSGFGLLNSDQNSGSGGTGSSLQKQAVQAENKAIAPDLPGSKIKVTSSQQAALWATATRLRFQAASAGFDTNSGQYTEAGKKELEAASTDWQRYLSLQKKGAVDLTLAKLMAQAYGDGGLGDGANGVKAWEIVVAAEPTGPNYAQLALAAYLAGDNKVAAKAADKALATIPKSQRATLKNQFIAAKAQFKLKQQQAAKQAGQGSSISPLGG
jgi:hypothetical protein